MWVGKCIAALRTALSENCKAECTPILKRHPEPDIQTSLSISLSSMFVCFAYLRGYFAFLCSCFTSLCDCFASLCGCFGSLCGCFTSLCGCFGSLRGCFPIFEWLFCMSVWWLCSSVWLFCIPVPAFMVLIMFYIPPKLPGILLCHTITFYQHNSLPAVM